MQSPSNSRQQYLETQLKELKRSFDVLTARIQALDKDLARALDGEQRLNFQERKDEKSAEREKTVCNFCEGGRFKDRLHVDQVGQEVRILQGFYEFSPQEQLDYASVRLVEEPLAALKADNAAELSAMELIRVGKHRGYLTAMPHFIALSQRVNILQHPRGAPLKVVLTQNRVTANMTETRVHYVADTDAG